MKTIGGHKVIIDNEGKLTKSGTIFTAAGGIRMVWDRKGMSWSRKEYDLDLPKDEFEEGKDA